MATQTKITDVGPVGLIPMGSYDPTATYSLLMTVLYNHDSWVCIAMTAEGEEKDITGIAPDDPTYGADNWQALTDGGRAAVAEAQAIRTEFDTWFGSTAASGIRKIVNDWLAQVQSAWNSWFGIDAESGVRKTFSDFMTLIQQTWTTWFGSDDTSGVQKQWKDLKTDATTATNRANTAAGVCEEWNNHPPYIADGSEEKPGDANYWYIWDTEDDMYIKSVYAKGDDLDWESMTQAEQQALAQMVLDHIAFDDEPTEGSDKAVKSGWLYNAFADITTALSGKQDTLTFATVVESEAAANELT